MSVSWAMPVLLLILLLFVACGIALLVVLARNGGGRVVPVPCCAQCHYPVRGLTTLACPECGADLREVGILTPAMRRSIGPGLAIVFWSLGLPIPAIVLSGLLTSIAIPQRLSYNDSWVLNPTTPSAVDRVEIEFSASRLLWPIAIGGAGGSAGRDQNPEQIELSVYLAAALAASPDATLSVDLVNQTWRLGADRTRRPLGTLDEAALSEFLGAPPLTDPLAQPLSDLVHAMRGYSSGRPGVSAVVNSPGLAAAATPRQSMSASRVGPIPGAMIGLAAFWLLVWIFGCIKLYRRQASART